MYAKQVERTLTKKIQQLEFEMKVNAFYFKSNPEIHLRIQEQLNTLKNQKMQ